MKKILSLFVLLSLLASCSLFQKDTETRGAPETKMPNGEKIESKGPSTPPKISQPSYPQPK